MATGFVAPARRWQDRPDCGGARVGLQSPAGFDPARAAGARQWAGTEQV